ncbi:MAG: hypothetical protein KQJ78_25250 [Deltaproteobacteria bacterium]|nr:hypothetical protein [Deltaproteobacteria bacterium]
MALLACLAALALGANAARAATFNVTSEAELTTALTTAATNDEDNTINLAAGTYNLAAPVTFNTALAAHYLVIQGEGGLAVLDGGGAHSVASFQTAGFDYTLTLRNLVFQNGFSPGGAGLQAIMPSTGGSFQMEDCQVMNNQGGGALGLGAMVLAEEVLLSRCVFAGNTATLAGTSGVGMAILPATAGRRRITNCLFANNIASSGGLGGGLYMISQGETFLINNTFVGNQAGTAGGAYLGLAVAPGAAGLYNNLFWGNTATLADTGDLKVEALGAPTAALPLWNNLLTSYSTGAGIFFSEVNNQSADPLLDANYRLTADSPCRDAGYNPAVADILLDLDSEPRVQHAVVDIGAYEYPVAGIALSPSALTPSAALGQSPAPQSFVLQNQDGGACDYTATADAPWLSVSPAGGTLPALGNQTMTVTYSTTGLAAGTYTATISVQDLTPGTGQTRTVAVTLTVGTGNLLGMHRAYCPYDGRRVFTVSAREIAALTALGWQDESSPLPFYVAGSDLTGSRTVYRLYNPNSGAHYLTTRTGERTALLALGWWPEHDQGRVFPTAVEGCSEVYTLYHPVLGEHFYTANAGEAWALVTYGAWQEARSLGYAFASIPQQVARSAY